MIKEKPVAEQATDEKYSLTDGAGNIIKQIAAFSQIAAANIKAGAIATTDFTTENVNAGVVIASKVTTDGFIAFQGTIDNLLIKSGLVTPKIQVALISPLPNESDVTVQVGTTTQSGKLAIQDGQGTEVASIDSTGNATFSGTVNSQSLNTGSATVSGELFASTIHSLTIDQIQEQLKQVKKAREKLFLALLWLRPWRQNLSEVCLKQCKKAPACQLRLNSRM